MYKPILIALLLVACAGVAAGADEREYMPLHSGGAARTVRYNDIDAEIPRSAVSGVDGAAAILAFSASPRVDGGRGFMEWKNHCHVQPPVVEGQAVYTARVPGFLHVSPYASKPGAESGVFLGALGLD